MAQAPNKGTTPAKKRTTKKKKNGYGRLILSVLMVILILVASAFIYYLGRTIYESYIRGEDESGGTDVNPIIYDTTPVEQSTKVGYYLLGLMGDEGAEGATDMLSLVCFDKQNKQMRLMHIPAATYLGDDPAFKVKQVSAVFSSPQDYVWCDVCRGRVYEPEQGEEGTHTVCGSKLSAKEGSPTVNLAEVINKQYGLPVDGLYIFEQDTFVKLVDLVGGVTVDLQFNVTVGDTTYAKGPRAIDGAAALRYIRASGDGIAKDLERFERFEQVFVAVMQRLFAMNEEKLAADVFQPLMVGSTPIRVGVNDGYQNIVALIKELSAVSFDNMISYVLPGEEAKLKDERYYSVHRDELLSLLNVQFNPHGEPLTEGDLNVTELASGKENDLDGVKLSGWVIEQNQSVTTTNTTTTTKAEG